jgi:heptose I phosphotransferase
LHVLPLLGVRVPAPIAWLRRAGRSLLVTAALPGRSLDAWALDAAAGGWLDELVDYAAQHVAPMVRKLHEGGLVHRDLYWNHVFSEDPRRGTPPALLDVERVFAPRWRWRRWLVKDLAGLLASLPVAVSTRQRLRFLRAYLGTLRGERALLAAIAAKAGQVRAHVPRYGT